MEEERLPSQHIIDNSFNVQRDDCPASFVRFQEEAVVGVVVEEIFRQGGGTECILQGTFHAESPRAFQENSGGVTS